MKRFDTPEIRARARALSEDQERENFRRTDLLFAWLLGAEWVMGILLACWVSPRAWAGASSTVHIHVLSAVGLGGAFLAAGGLLSALAGTFGALAWHARPRERSGVVQG